VEQDNGGICLIDLHRISNKKDAKKSKEYLIIDVVYHVLPLSKKEKYIKNRNVDYAKENVNGFYVHNADSNIKHNCNHIKDLKWIDDESDNYIKHRQDLGNKNTKKEQINIKNNESKPNNDLINNNINNIKKTNKITWDLTEKKTIFLKVLEKEIKI